MLIQLLGIKPILKNDEKRNDLGEAIIQQKLGNKTVETISKNMEFQLLNGKIFFSIQCGVCAICKEPQSVLLKGELKRLAVDHCHKTKKIRGLLCDNCNKGLGLFKDKPELLNSASEYLRLNQ